MKARGTARNVRAPVKTRKSIGQKAKIAGRPFVLVNMSMTADGKIATANRAVSSFGSNYDAKHLLELRATAEAVMAGARTVDLNRIIMGPGPALYRRRRLRRGLEEYNLRIIVSRSASIKVSAEIFKRRFSPIIVLTSSCAPAGKVRQLRKLGAEVKVCGQNQIDFKFALAWLRREWNVRRLLCEGGGEVNDALFRSDLVDELHLTICPLIFGGRNAPTIADGEGAASLPTATQMKLKSARQIGQELFLVYTR